MRQILRLPQTPVKRIRQVFLPTTQPTLDELLTGGGCRIRKVVKVVYYEPVVIEVTPSTRSIGENIIAERNRLGLKQQDLAARLGLDPGNVSRWESASSSI
jgi:hypothetical protein